MTLNIAIFFSSFITLALTLPANNGTTRHLVNVTVLNNSTANVWGTEMATGFLDNLVKYLQWDQIETTAQSEEEVFELPTPESLILLEASSEAIQSTPQEASEKSVTGKIYGFFQHLGDKIKNAFVHVKDVMG